MAFRGRGRGGGFGRGRGTGYDNRIGKHEPYHLFPEDVNLPSVPNVDSMQTMENKIILMKYKLERFWDGSCYHLQKTASGSKNGDTEIERYSDRYKPREKAKREALAQYLKLIPSNFPSELIQGSKRLQHENKRLRWDRDAGEQKWEMFEKLEEKFKEQDGKEVKDKKSDSEDEDEAEEEEVESSDDDYNQNVDFDDDEDDLNMEAEADEDYYE